MQIEISGQHMSISKSLQDYVKDRTNEVVRKCFENAPSAHVHFIKQGYEVVCDILVNDGTGRHMVIKSKQSSDEAYHAFDIALSKIEKQMRKYKSKLQDHHKQKKISEIIPQAVEYILSPEALVEENDTGSPAIIAEEPSHLMSLTVGGAVMRMDLQSLPALMFENAKTGRINVVYYRKDGNISWVDSIK